MRKQDRSRFEGGNLKALRVALKERDRLRQENTRLLDSAGEPIAMVDLGWLEETGHGMARNCAEAVRLYETAVKAGVPAAMNNLGLLYLRGQCVGRDYAEARRLFERCIPLGEPACMNGMGVIYNEGDGVPRNISLSRQWFEKAAALGDHEARQNLAGMRR